MMFSFMFVALPSITVEKVSEVLNALDLGTIRNIDRAVISTGPKRGLVKFFVHYSESTSVDLRMRLYMYHGYREDGDMVQPVRIVYDVKKNGTEMFWQIYECPTPEQRDKVKREFKPRLE